MKTYQMYIDGQFVTSTSGQFFDVINPATEEVIASVTKGTVEETRAAIDAADKAQNAWEQLPAIERAGYLRKIAHGIRERTEEIARVISSEMGKTLPLARVEVNFTADYIDYMAEWARRYEGEILQSDRSNEHIFIYKKAIGVTTGILPWNFPFFLIARKMAPALVTGNTIVVKPSVDSPINAILFAEIVHSSGLPKGVFNLVHGAGGEIGQELAGNPKVGLVSLTGSEPAGRKVMEAASRNITKVNLELGGKAPAIVLADANLDLAAKAIVASRIINSGQVCNCAERIYVQREVKEVFTQKLVELMKKVRLGNPLEDETLDMGPMVNKQGQLHAQAMVDEAIKAGGRCLLGGHSVKGKGYYFEPTIIDNVTNDMAILRQEIFAPVIPIATFETIDEVIELANDCEYGLTSSIYTQNINKAMKLISRLKFGETYVNRENFEAMQGFHAGWRKSGIGGADGKHGLEEYLQTHVVYLQYDQNI
ncbi:aldehyde dehydrogenase [Haemophilus parahaemolyticus]|uniref:Aldehyde dehydrogenase n=2 Tax=Haemophilus parahaemolyticus TaxID=735 RepID=A0A377HYA9_HAEPH|nr:aldehyde dehydrogenase [Haemophilus parahaemolyticus]EIJ70319.1 lactaldehyde dehydrogenase [Haemophilus parahaemolyticus HK385]OOR95743.1 aldehyde dehydrogenase [Haemophilus parahaemolyticus]QEN11238.1 aldehyde dehydrogenase [Haemophilus parahaemolyticus]QRP12432.1 aldehyde dehydrogenase [Haemophilus parahaemolyticus]STO63253.1 succinate-semialdehyde dehydrogenase [Haemophilus parahaemolyticus]